MNPVKRLGLAVLVLILGAVLAASPALAGGKEAVTYRYNLAPPQTDPPEPRASGRWTKTVNAAYPYAGTHVEASCTRLTVGKQYQVLALVSWNDIWGNSGSYWTGVTSTADGKGRLDAQFDVEALWGEQFVYVTDLRVYSDQGVVLETER